MHNSILLFSIAATLMFALLAYVNIYMVFLFRRKQFEFFTEKERWTEMLLEERDRVMDEVASEVHDNLGSYITMLKTTISGLVKARDEKEESRLKESASQLVTELSELSADISYSLRGKGVENHGLVVALQQDIERIEMTHQVTCDYQRIGTIRYIDPEKERIIYRIAQEGIQNALKHAETDRLCFTLSFTEHDFTFCLEDNGIGFDQELAERKNKMGLTNMRQRAARLNASLTFDTRPGLGTMMVLTVPI